MVEKHNLLEILGNFRRVSKNFLRKFQEMHYFSIFFKETEQTMRYLFAGLDVKPKLLGNFEKTLKVFDENSIEKLTLILLF